MYPRILHIYGPLWIQSYGVMIAIGFLTFIACTLNHPLRKKYISSELYLNGLFIGLASGIIGGRLLHVILYPKDFSGRWIEVIFPWEGGLVVWGAIIGVIITASTYLSLHKVPILPILDLVALYAPLMQAISRIGCFLSGCCYGLPAHNLLWAVTFTNPFAQAPLHIPLHPTQIYMSITSLVVFFVLRYSAKCLERYPGTILSLFLVLESAARFFIDFWRADRDTILTSCIGSLSSVQVLSLVLGLGAALFFVFRIRATTQP